MKILITGAGGREHALGWKINRDAPDATLLFAPGNAGTAALGQNFPANDAQAILALAKAESVDLTIIGSEDILAEGIVDTFQAAGLAIFGPHQQAAQLESSKAFAKEFMQRHGVKTAAYANFTDYDAAQAYLQQQDLPVVIKASGLAAGKGVVICQTRDEAEQTLRSIMLDKQFGNAGNEVVIEEFLTGFEASILSVCSGDEIVAWHSAMDHKQAYDHDQGPNTGGMGVVAPHPFWSEQLATDVQREIIEPTAAGLRADGLGFTGFIFFGLMVTDKGIYCLEYNLRLGDPETQAILPLLESNLLTILTDAIAGKSTQPQWSDDSACALVIAAEGYPGKYPKGQVVERLDQLTVPTFLAGITQQTNDTADSSDQSDSNRTNNTAPVLVTNGGRLLCLIGMGNDLTAARKAAYNNAEILALPQSFYRTDIGLRVNPFG